MPGRNPSYVYSRREFIKHSGLAFVGFSAFGTYGVLQKKDSPLIILEKAEGLVIGDPALCIGCLRCELACTEFNDGKASPSLARIKTARNMNFGPKGVFAGHLRQGNWGNGLITPDSCLQCPHPVLCADACPHDAITALAPLYARAVDPEKCVGCRMCLRSCPWEMMSFDEETHKASKCFLCDGKPKCVEACPAGALRYISWTDLTDRVPIRSAPASVIPPAKSDLCIDCHKNRGEFKE